MSNIELYNRGDIIGGVVDIFTYSAVYYDGSKILRNGNIFNRVGCPESLFLGDDYDDVETMEEVLDKLLKFLNLNIIQNGYDFYIFSDSTLSAKDSITWTNIDDDTTHNSSLATINVDKDFYIDTDTNISTDDVYTQIKVKAKLDKFDVVLESPLDDDSLISPYDNMQQYMTEYISEGNGNTALNAFKAIVNGRTTDYDKAYTYNWFIRDYMNSKWSFTRNGVDVFGTYYEKSDLGSYINQWKILSEMRKRPLMPAIIGFGRTDQKKLSDNSPLKAPSITKSLVISINGNGVGKPLTYTFYSKNANDEWTSIQKQATPYPTDNDLKNAKMSIKYKSASSGTYSPTDSSITNYIVFSGKIVLNPIQAITDLTENYNIYKSLLDKKQWVYAGQLKDKTFADSKKDGNAHNTVPSGLNEYGKFYALKYFNTRAPLDKTVTSDETMLSANPFFDDKENKLLQYNVTGYNNPNNGIDGIYKIPILACQLKIGDKYCVETILEDGSSKYDWVKESDLTFDFDDDGTKVYNDKFYLGPDLAGGDYLVGEEHDMANNIHSYMNLGSVSGTAIPIKASDALAGDLTFEIVGVCNITFDELVRRHKTWFRHTTWSSKCVQVLPYCENIIIKNFNVKLASDNGGYDTTYEDNGLVYCSDENHNYVTDKQIDFDLISGVDASTAFKCGINATTFKNCMIDMVNKAPVDTIDDSVTKETAKPEMIYVNDKYMLYSKPKLIVETTFKYDKCGNEFANYKFNYFKAKKFVTFSHSINLKTDSITLKLREQ